MTIVIARFHLPRRLTPKAGDYIMAEGWDRWSETGGEAPGANTFKAAPLVIETPQTVDRICFRKDGAGGAGALLRAGIYTSQGGRPKARVLDSGAVDVTGAAADVEVTVSQYLSAGECWLAILTNDGAVAVRTGRSSPHGQPVVGGTDYSGLTVAQAYGALPADASALAWAKDTRLYLVYLRAA